MSMVVDSKELLERFLRYVKLNTRSDENNADQVPSTPSQVDFAHQLEEELKEIGMQDIYYNPEDSYVTATLPSNDPDHDYPVFGLFAHRDTADFNAEGIAPQIIENYDGGVIPLSDSGYSLDPAEFPSLNKYEGQTLITTDGRTLLGADDKSGIAEIMTALHYLIEHPEIKHGDIKIGFGPDEEIGMGATRFDVERFKADFAYTIDGGPLGELEWETFSAAQAVITFNGKNVHPGTAKDTMINALQLAIDYHNALAAHDRPEKTEGREGFYHLLKINGEVDSAKAIYIVRDHDETMFNYRKEQMKKIALDMNQAYGKEVVEIKVDDQYYNMGQILKDDMRPVELAKKSYKDCGVEPKIEAVRGGTDGSIMTFRGLPTPNLFAGGENMHARFEYVSLQTMEKMVEILVKLVENSKDYDQFKKTLDE